MSRDLSDIESSSAFADALYSGVQIVADYMKGCSHMVEGVLPKSDTADRDAAMQGLWYRALAWMLSLKELNHTRHFQAIAAGNRALLELAVDTVHLHVDKTNGTGWKMRWWALSEKLKAAQSTIRYYAERNISLPLAQSDLQGFINREQNVIEAQRLVLWGNGTAHPRRWTKHDLSVDVEQADRVLPVRFKDELRKSLTEHYRTEYRMMNWQIHSGLAIVTRLPPETYNLIAANSLLWCADLAMLITQIVLIDYGFGDALEGLSGRWKDIARQRLWVYAQKMGIDINKS